MSKQDSGTDDIDLTDEERDAIKRQRSSRAAGRKLREDAEALGAFMTALAQEQRKLNLDRVEALCAGGTIADESLEGLLPRVFGEGWERELRAQTDCPAIAALIDRTEPARRAKRDAEDAEIRNHPRDY